MFKSNKTKKSSKPAKSAVPKAKITFKRNLLPPILGIFITGAVLFTLNGQWLVAQIEYRIAPPVVAAAPVNNQSSTPASTKIDPNAAPQITIAKIGVKAPLVMDESSYDESKIELALRGGPVHYGTTALPGQVGNAVILGHSSGQLWAPGNYKFVFTLLDKLAPGDTITIGYKGTLYTYKVTDSEVVKPTDFTILTQTTFPEISLVTCTPVGTSTNRLVVHAKQISPDPSTATPASSSTNPADALALPQ